MSKSPRKWGPIVFCISVIFVILACSLSAETGTAVPNYDATQAALQLQGTAMMLQATQAALGNGKPIGQQVADQPTAAPATAAPAPAATDIPASPTPDIEAKIKGAKVLLYEDTDELGIGQWIEEAVQGMGLDYIQTGSYSGHFMENLNSGKHFDLIIMGGEDRSKISGEFWDVISTRLARDKAALIMEVWYLQREWNGPIAKILGPCGVQFRKQYDSAESIYWWNPTHEVFNTPNQVMPLLHYNTYWWTEAGDKLLLNGGDATMLAGLSSSPSSGEGVLATCFQGRVIVQTFSNHDYREAEIVPLWQNYIHYTLKNHFLAAP